MCARGAGQRERIHTDWREGRIDVASVGDVGVGQFGGERAQARGGVAGVVGVAGDVEVAAVDTVGIRRPGEDPAYELGDPVDGHATGEHVGAAAVDNAHECIDVETRLGGGELERALVGRGLVAPRRLVGRRIPAAGAVVGERTTEAEPDARGHVLHHHVSQQMGIGELRLVIRIDRHDVGVGAACRAAGRRSRSALRGSRAGDRRHRAPGSNRRASAR